MPSYSNIVETDGTENIIISSAVATLTQPSHYSSSGVSAGRARIRVHTAPILYTLNGVDPIAGDERYGDKLKPRETLTLHTLAEMSNLKMIQAAPGIEGEVFVQYDKRTG
jgi:hypothetical protein